MITLETQREGQAPCPLIQTFKIMTDKEKLSSSQSSSSQSSIFPPLAMTPEATVSHSQSNNLDSTHDNISSVNKWQSLHQHIVDRCNSSQYVQQKARQILERCNASNNSDETRSSSLYK